LIITEIAKQKNNPKRYSVSIDGEFAFGLEEIDILQYRLKEGMELTQEEYLRIMDYSVFEKAKAKAFRYLGYSARTYKEVYEKLSDGGFPEEAIEKTMELLLSYGYVDDSRYAADYVKEYSKKYGKDRMKFELMRKGVAQGTIEEALEASEIDETEAIIELMSKRFRSGPTDEIDEKEKRRCYDYLSRRGYSYEKIMRAFKEFFV